MNPYGRIIVRTFALCTALMLSLATFAEDVAKPPSSKSKPPASLVSKHLKFLSADGITRYRYVDKGSGKVTDRDEQYKVSTRVQIDLVGEGVTYIQGRGESGRSFASSYDYTGMGLNKGY
jgi:hypothetical protein